MNTNLIPRTTIIAICGHRDSAVQKMAKAAALIEEGHRQAEAALVEAAQAYGGSTFTLKDRATDGAYRRLFQHFDRDASLDVFRKQVDARVWMHLLALTGMDKLMDRTAKEQLDKDLCGDVPEVSPEAAREIFENLLGDAELIFQRGLARAFGDLDRRFKSHDGFKIGSRVILTRVFDAWGSWNYHSKMRDTIADIERVFSVLDGKQPNVGALTQAIQEDRKGGFNPRQSVTETPYFRIRCFKNGNAHLWFKRDDLVQKANRVLADYYGEVLPDGVPAEDSPDDLRTVSGLPSRNLSFYPTPDPVVEKVLRNAHFRKGTRVLEPSAGTGNMVRHLLRHDVQVTAVEIDPSRVAALETIGHPRLAVVRANFLQLPADPTYDLVVMNPPFYGTHWMEHVIHAFGFLAPGGTLLAVLPVTAQIGQSKKHTIFQSWVKNHTNHGSPYSDLPAESFAKSGTRINTIILSLHKSHRWASP